MKFREHRGGLEDSLATIVEVAGWNALITHIKKLAESWPTFPLVTDDTVHVWPYQYDERIGWDTHIVTIDGYGVIGFMDSGWIMKEKAGIVCKAIFTND